MNAAFASLLFVVAFVVATSAYHKELCNKNDQVLGEELECIGNHIPASTNAAYEEAVKKLGCSDRSCAMRLMCARNDLDRAMSMYFTAGQIKHIHDAAFVCDPDIPHGN